jgi:uncharacterized membrane protein
VASSLDAVWSVATLLAGTVVLMVGFLAFFLVAGARDLGPARTLGFLLWGLLVALVGELSSTRVGVPFGVYHYTGATARRGAVPLQRPVLLAAVVSFPGLCLFQPRPPGARAGLGREPRGPASPGGPVGCAHGLAGRRDRSAGGARRPLVSRPHLLLPGGGIYFGVPLSNFAGWLLVGWATVGGYVWAAGDTRLGSPRPGLALCYVVLAGNLTVTLWIGELLIAGAGIVVHMAVCLLLYNVSRVTLGRWSVERLSATS